MGKLTEREIFDRMTGCLKAAASCCAQLSVSPARGQLYDQLRKNLRLAGDCCRQAATWREDARWLNFDKQLTHCHKIAGDWLRGYKNDAGHRVHLAPSEIYQLFTKLGLNLAAMHTLAETTRDAKTQKRGMILPKIHHETRTQGRPSAVKLPPGMMARQSGLIVPQETMH